MTRRPTLLCFLREAERRHGQERLPAAGAPGRLPGVAGEVRRPRQGPGAAGT